MGLYSKTVERYELDPKTGHLKALLGTGMHLRVSWNIRDILIRSVVSKQLS